MPNSASGLPDQASWVPPVRAEIGIVTALELALVAGVVALSIFTGTRRLESKPAATG